MERLTPRGASPFPARGCSRRYVACLLATCATLGLAPAASAQTWKPDPGKNPSPSPAQVAEAKERYEKGVKLYDDEANVQAARVEFERAYDLAPNYKVLYNIGQAARTLRDYAAALQAFEAYLEGGGDKLAKARAAEVRREITQLRTYVAKLTVQVDIDGATITIDGVNVGTSPLAKPLLVNAGRLGLAASKEGRVGTTLVTLAGGDEQTVRIDLPAAPKPGTEAAKVAAPSAAAPLAPPPAPLVVARPSRNAPYLLIGVGAALGASAGITGFAALRTANNLEKQRFAGATPSPEVDHLRTRTQRLSLASDVLTGAAVVSAAVGVVLLVLEPTQPAGASAPLRAFAIRPFASPSNAGLTGEF